jgi:hypothetical protein
MFLKFYDCPLARYDVCTPMVCSIYVKLIPFFMRSLLNPAFQQRNTPRQTATKNKAICSGSAAFRQLAERFKGSKVMHVQLFIHFILYICCLLLLIKKLVAQLHSSMQHMHSSRHCKIQPFLRQFCKQFC